MGKYRWLVRQVNYDQWKTTGYGEPESEEVVGWHPLQRTLLLSGGSAHLPTSEHVDTASKPTVTVVDASEDIVDPLGAGRLDSAVNHSPVDEVDAVVQSVDDDCLQDWELTKQWIQRLFSSSRLGTSNKSLGSWCSVGALWKSKRHLGFHLFQQRQFETSPVMKSEVDTVKRAKNFEEDIRETKSTLEEEWSAGRKVNAFEMALQCCQYLSDANYTDLYPLVFMNVTELLQRFGRMVLDRVSAQQDGFIASCGKPMKLTTVNTDDSDDDLPELCQNWLHKVNSVRELLPRFYMECAISTMYSLFDEDRWRRASLKLAKMARGIGHSIMALYARCFLAVMSSQLRLSCRDHLLTCVEDTVASFSSTFVQHHYDMVRIPLQWILRCYFYGCSSEEFRYVFELFVDHQLTDLLGVVIAAAPLPFVLPNTWQVLQLVKLSCSNDAAGHSAYPTEYTLIDLGHRLSEATEHSEEGLKLIKEVWKIFRRSCCVQTYVMCADVWFFYACRNLTLDKALVLLDDVLLHVLPEKKFAQFYLHMFNMLDDLMNHCDIEAKFTTVLNDKTFGDFCDQFGEDDFWRKEVSRLILRRLNSFAKDFRCDDVVVANQLLLHCRFLHDSLDALSIADESRAISDLINGTLDRVAFDAGENVQHQLDFYVQARGYFHRLDSVIGHLVTLVNRLCLTCHRQLDAAESQPFAQSCVAFSYITIPSLEDSPHKLRLFLESSFVAMTSLRFPQSFALLKSTITLLSDLFSGDVVDDTMFCDAVKNILNLIIALPDTTGQRRTYLLRGLLNCVLRSSQSLAEHDRLVSLLPDFLVVLSTLLQSRVPLHVSGLKLGRPAGKPTANAAGDMSFEDMISETASNVLETLNCFLEDQTATGYSASTGHRLLFKILEVIAVYGDLDTEEMCRLTTTLWRTIRDRSPETKAEAKRFRNFIISQPEDDRNRIFFERLFTVN